jgi:very-short-patch-repair endonuclease
MAWEEFMVAVEYDGDQHRTSRPQYVKDIRVLPKLAAMGWIVIRAIKEDRDDDIVERAWTALVSRGWCPDRR